MAALCFGANELSNRRAPSFNLPDRQLKEVDILDYRGKWLLIDFMKSDCPHCVDLTKSLETLKAKYAGKVEVVSIVIAPPEDLMSVGRYISANRVTAPIVFDQGQVARGYFKLSPQKSAYDTPHLFVVDPSGNIVRDWGWDDASKVLQNVTALGRELDAVMGGGAKK